jgi:pimeloyl-ACP methyl ester carboxylesterase
VPWATNLSAFEPREIAVDGLRLRGYVAGAGPSALLLHGLGGVSANWAGVAPALARTHRVLLLDLPGHGASEPFPRRVPLAAFADVVASALRAVGLGPALVAGHSLGGLVALRLAQRAPVLVRSLLLCAPAGISSSTRLAQVVVTLTGLTRPGKLVAPLRYRWARSPRYRRAVFRPWLVSDADALPTEIVLGFLDGPPQHADTLTAGRAMLRDDPREELDRVRCPALVLWGARDMQLPVDDAFEYARRLRAPLRLVADCGHLLIGERPEAVLDGIRELEELPVEAEALRE